jgi:hypothetical protein
MSVVVHREIFLWSMFAADCNTMELSHAHQTALKCEHNYLSKLLET